ncbi:ATP-dependent RNA helicase RhlB [bacterium BMS3Abin07]|nr:ATP-dependent RNA helicase RhlB [bacterium BMS3Abin07]GBE33398.1 ATP-dependent RNA helicase RhlB [bacterium BMS3Bbin05]HDL19643.1 DEAD/DEAH box helicase [Nitrospirota bacterium]HDO23581.1 DEAD/DEAH box helicase [Nitrospirota bacterium]HDZ88217.1 DEAD/DEAH box helicase [Nitrospirota bacterium]
MRFKELEIPEPVLKGIRAAGFKECTPIQALSLPNILAGKDVAAQAQTGTGKTAAFLIGVFSRMHAGRPPVRGTSPQALIIAPTRELVVQIEAEAKILGGPNGFRILSVYGGVDYRKQRERLTRGGDLLIGTPGRLIDYLKQKVYRLKSTRFLVIDEADRMFDMGFISDLRFLLRRMSPYNRRQSLLFSATLTTRVMELCYEHMNNPERITVTPDHVTVEQVEQEIYHVGNTEKFGLLLNILAREPGSRYLIFCNMKTTADKLMDHLNANGYKSAAITGSLDQEKRLRVLTRFRNGELPILVATDVASRGLHIEGVTHVINYDLPQDADDYVHRIGRTARAGATGKAISLACEDYVTSLPNIEEYIKQKIPVTPLTDEMIVAGYKEAPRRKSTHPRRKGTQIKHGKKK